MSLGNTKATKPHMCAALHLEKIRRTYVYPKAKTHIFLQTTISIYWGTQHPSVLSPKQMASRCVFILNEETGFFKSKIQISGIGTLICYTRNWLSNSVTMQKSIYNPFSSSKKTTFSITYGWKCFQPSVWKLLFRVYCLTLELYFWALIYLFLVSLLFWCAFKPAPELSYYQ